MIFEETLLLKDRKVYVQLDKWTPGEIRWVSKHGGSVRVEVRVGRRSYWVTPDKIQSRPWALEDQQ